MNPSTDFSFEEEPESNYRFEPESQDFDDSDTTKGTEQAASSLIAHGLGAVVALPGNVRDLILATSKDAKKLRKYMYEKAGMAFDDEFIENNSYKEFNESIQAPFKFLINNLPNSEQVNDFIDTAFNGYFAPTNDYQKFANDTAQDIVMSALNRNPKNLVQNFLIPAGSNVLKKTAELYGVDPNASEKLKMLSWIGADMAYIANSRAYLGQAFNQTRRMINPNDMIDVSARDLRYLDQLERSLGSGGSRPSTQAALTKLREMRQAMQGGQVSAREVLDFYRSNNELLNNFGAFNVEGAGRPGHVRNLNRVQTLNRNMLNRYGRNQNAQFLQSFRENNLAWATLENSNNVAAYVRRNYTKPFVSEAAKGFFMNTGAKGIAVATGLSALERMQSFIRRLENPVLRRYYGQVLRHSLESNAGAMIKSMNKFDETARIIEERERKQKKTKNQTNG